MNRRGFIHALGTAVVAATLGLRAPVFEADRELGIKDWVKDPASGWSTGNTALRKGDTFTIEGVYDAPQSTYLQEFVAHEFEVTTVKRSGWFWRDLTLGLKPLRRIA